MPRVDKRVTHIAGVELDYPLFITNEFNSTNYIGEREFNNAGKNNEFIQPKGDSTLEVIVSSNEHGWVRYETIKQLQQIDQLSPFTLDFDDTTSDTYSFDHTKVPIEKESLYYGAEWYTITLNLVKV